MKSNKNAFWQAFVFTIFVFLIGLMLGMFLENQRLDEVQISVLNSEVNLLDEQLRPRIFEEFDVNCDDAKKGMFDFADKVYEEALQLEKYDEASKFGNELREVHKRYDLLRVMLWTDAIDLRKRCSKDFHTVVYFYDYDTEDLDLKARQLFYSRMLGDLKEKYPERVLLIPIAGSMDLVSINVIRDKYDVNEFPIIIIDETRIIREIVSFEGLENIVFNQ